MSSTRMLSETDSLLVQMFEHLLPINSLMRRNLYLASDKPISFEVIMSDLTFNSTNSNESFTF